MPSDLGNHLTGTGVRTVLRATHPPTESPYRIDPWLLGILGLALGLRVLATWFFAHELLRSADAGDIFAVNFLSGKGFGLREGIPSSYRPPLQGFFLIGVYFLFGRSNWSVGLSHAVVSSLVPLLTYLIARRVSCRATAVVAAFLTAIYPYFVYHDIHGSKAPLTTVMLLSMMYFLLKAKDEPRLWNVAWGGVFAALTAMNNPVHVIFIPAAVLWMIDCSKSIQQRMKVSCLFLLVFAGVLSPWVIRNYLVHGEFVLLTTDGGKAFWKAHNPNTLGILYAKEWVDEVPSAPDAPSPGPMDGQRMTLTEPRLERWYYRKGLEYVMSHPYDALKITLLNLTNFWSWKLNPRTWSRTYGNESVFVGLKNLLYTLSYGFILVFAIVGVTLDTDTRRSATLFFFVFVSWTIGYTIYVGSTRYRVPLDPLLAVFAASGVLAARGKIRAFGDLRAKAG